METVPMRIASHFTSISTRLVRPKVLSFDRGRSEVWKLNGKDGGHFPSPGHESLSFGIPSWMFENVTIEMEQLTPTTCNAPKS
ncbi:hypothetical protein AC579_5206 [Pseudocercospora musae]|uniref:Uncharacterized protein n=1 Tax=Pseudocercospora musae TaxID=113226 RepID=A0A139IDN9_9PEZI|nr:hypothetical protein AC579_5206 [Pseudocercospora musae]